MAKGFTEVLRCEPQYRAQLVSPATVADASARFDDDRVVDLPGVPNDGWVTRFGLVSTMVLRPTTLLTPSDAGRAGALVGTRPRCPLARAEASVVFSARCMVETEAVAWTAPETRSTSVTVTPLSRSQVATLSTCAWGAPKLRS